MGKVISRLNRQFYRFNAENRAHREISKKKPQPAPRHPSAEKALEAMLEETKHIKNQMQQKDSALDGYLKKVYVKSHDPIIEKGKKPSEKQQLPLNRSRLEETELGYFEPDIVPKGKVTLRQVMQFLADNQGDPKLFSATKISSDYTLPEKDVEHVLEYFSSFKVHIREKQLQVEENKDKVLKFFGSDQKPVLLERKENAKQQKSES